jgi:hypothetical protein
MGKSRRFMPFVDMKEYNRIRFIHGYNIKWDIPNELYKGDLTIEISTPVGVRTEMV